MTCVLGMFWRVNEKNSNLWTNHSFLSWIFCMNHLIWFANSFHRNTFGYIYGAFMSFIKLENFSPYSLKLYVKEQPVQSSKFHPRIWQWIYVCMCVYICLYVCMYLSISIYLSIYIYIYIYMCVFDLDVWVGYKLLAQTVWHCKPSKASTESRPG